MPEYTLLQINILSGSYTLLGILFARWLWRKEINLGKKVRENEKSN